MTRSLLALFLLVNVVGAVANLPAILAAVDGEAVGATLSRWTIGIGEASGQLVEQLGASALDAAAEPDLPATNDDPPLQQPTDDEHVARLEQLWRLLEAAGNALDPQDVVPDPGA